MDSERTLRARTRLSSLTLVLFHFQFHLSFGYVTVSLLVLGLLLTCEILCPWPALCDLLELLVSAQCCVAFSHMSLVWRFVLFLVLLFSFLAIPIHLMHKSLSPNRAGRVNFHRRFWFFVCLLVLGVCVFWFFTLVFCLVFSVFLSARDDDTGPCKGPRTVRLLLIQSSSCSWYRG